MKQKNMQKHAKDKKVQKSLVFLTLLLGVTLVSSPMVFGATLQERINELNSENSNIQEDVGDLEDEAASLEDKINRIQTKINAIQGQINENKAQIAELKKEIKKAEKELAKQKDLLGQNIRAMYLESEISTLEMLASSKNLSDFVDKEQYRNSVQDKIKVTVDKINELKHELGEKKTGIEKRLKEQEALNSELGSKRAESSGLLALNESEQASLDARIKKNSKKIAELKRQQAIENANRLGYSVGVAGGGGYPWGNAYCLHTGNVGGDCWNYDWVFGGSLWDPWSYGYRNCTSWVAYRVASTGKFMPSGLGNAKNWIYSGASRGYKVSRTPKVGAAAVSTGGTYGHVMYVESVNGDGSIVVSDYNRLGDGLYRITSLSAGSASSLYYVYL